MLAFSAKEGQNTLVFAGVFSLVWIGGAIITLNGQLLGGNLLVFPFFKFFCCFLIFG